MFDRILLVFFVCNMFAVNLFACGEDQCPAEDSDPCVAAKRCDDYNNYKGEFASRPRLRCLDMCYSKCVKVIKASQENCSSSKEEDAISMMFQINNSFPLISCL